MFFFKADVRVTINSVQFINLQVPLLFSDEASSNINVTKCSFSLFGTQIFVLGKSDYFLFSDNDLTCTRESSPTLISICPKTANITNIKVSQCASLAQISKSENVYISDLQASNFSADISTTYMIQLNPIEVANSSIILRNLRFSSLSSVGLGGTFGDKSVIKVSNCTFQNLTNYPIYFQLSSANLSIESSQFLHSSIVKLSQREASFGNAKIKIANSEFSGIQSYFPIESISNSSFLSGGLKVIFQSNYTSMTLYNVSFSQISDISLYVYPSSVSPLPLILNAVNCNFTTDSTLAENPTFKLYSVDLTLTNCLVEGSFFCYSNKDGSHSVIHLQGSTSYYPNQNDCLTCLFFGNYQCPSKAGMISAIVIGVLVGIILFVVAFLSWRKSPKPEEYRGLVNETEITSDD